MRIVLFLTILLSVSSCGVNPLEERIHTSDIDLFWEVFDQIKTISDSTEQVAFFQKNYLDKGSIGLSTICEVRRYTAEEYVYTINHWPKFWESIRANTLEAEKHKQGLVKGIGEFEKRYPNLRHADIYFTIGAFRTNGTTLEDKVLIGSELAMADKNTVTDEFPEYMAHLRSYFDTNPKDNLVFLFLHEYVHTQQETPEENTLLQHVVREGIAEFVAEKITGEASFTPAIAYGKKNEAAVKQQFEQEMFNPEIGYWLWSNRENKFGLRDMGYFIGYALAEKHFQKAENKDEALAKLIELDLNDERALENYVDEAAYLPKKIEDLKAEYTRNVPTVRVLEFENNSQNVDSSIRTLTLEFSQPMDTLTRGFDFGPLGEDHALKLQRYLGYAPDGKSLRFAVDMKPNRHYQLQLPNKFRSARGVEMRPYLIDFKTRN